jgi:hypothetical protein
LPRAVGEELIQAKDGDDDFEVLPQMRSECILPFGL